MSKYKYIRYNKQKDTFILTMDNEGFNDDNYIYIDINTDKCYLYYDIEQSILKELFILKYPEYKKSNNLCVYKVDFNDYNDYSIECIYLHYSSSRTFMIENNYERNLTDYINEVILKSETSILKINEKEYVKGVNKLGTLNTKKRVNINCDAYDTICDLIVEKYPENPIEIFCKVFTKGEEKYNLYVNDRKIFGELIMEVTSEKHYRFLDKHNLLNLSKYDYKTDFIKEMKSNSVYLNNIDKIAKRLEELNSSSVQINHFIGMNKQEDFDAYMKAIDMYSQMPDKNIYRALDDINKIYILINYFNYDKQDLLDYILNAGFSQGISLSTSVLDALLDLRLFNFIKDNEYPNSLVTLWNRNVKNRNIMKCKHCGSINIHDFNTCPICKGNDFINAGSLTFGKIKYDILDSKFFNFITLDVESLFKMKISYYSLKKTLDKAKVPLSLFPIINKIVNCDFTEEDFKDNQYYTYTSSDIDFMREDKIRILRGNRKYNNLSNLYSAIKELSGFISNSLNIEIDDLSLSRLYENPSLELLYKTKYNVIIPAIVEDSNSIMLNIKNGATSIKGIFKNRNKNQLEEALDLYNSYSDLPCIHKKSLAQFLFGEREDFNIAKLYVNLHVTAYKDLTKEDISRKYYSYNTPGYNFLNIFNMFKNCAKYSSFVKLNNYIIKVLNTGDLGNELEEILKHIEDYYQSLELLNPDEDIRKFDLFPKDLILAHNRAAYLYSIKKNETLEKNFTKRYNENKIMNYEDENSGYAIISPETSKDLQKEGLSLNHCVGTYINKYIEGRCKIFFMRKIDAKDQSLVTIELNKNNELVQAKGKHNRDITIEERAFIKKWLKKVA